MARKKKKRCLIVPSPFFGEQVSAFIHLLTSTECHLLSLTAGVFHLSFGGVGNRVYITYSSLELDSVQVGLILKTLNISF